MDSISPEVPDHRDGKSIADSETQEQIYSILSCQRGVTQGADSQTGDDKGPSGENDNKAISYMDDLVMKIIINKPKLFDERARILVSQYYHKGKLKVSKLMDLKNLERIQASKFPTLAWLKFELLIKELVQKQLYEPSILANELIFIVKNELDSSMSSRLRSLIQSCINDCRSISSTEIEEEHKWCEIIDWISWAICEEENNL